MKKLMVLGVVVLFVVVIAAAALAASGPASPSQSTSGYGTGSFSHAQLESDLVMTQQMSSGDHLGHNCAAAMLQRSSDQAYVRALEQHAADLDRSLARTP